MLTGDGLLVLYAPAGRWLALLAEGWRLPFVVQHQRSGWFLTSGARGVTESPTEYATRAEPVFTAVCRRCGDSISMPCDPAHVPGIHRVLDRIGWSRDENGFRLCPRCATGPNEDDPR